MPHTRRFRRDRPFYLIPIMMGMAGVLFSSQLEDPVLRGTVVLLCLAVPLFLGGNLLGRIYSRGLQRFLLIGGMITLTIGAVVTVSGLSESLVDSEYVSREVGELSNWLGMGGLFLGLTVVMYSMVRSEALIDELGDRFRHIADHVGEGFVLMDQDGTVILINQALTDITGIVESDMVGQKIRDAAERYQIEAVVRHAESRERGLLAEYELDWDKEGEPLRLLVKESPFFDRRKNRVGSLLTVHDITEEHRLKLRLEEYTQGLQKLVENRTEKLRDSEKRYRDLLMHMNEGFVTLDENFHVRFANEHILGLLRIRDPHTPERDFLQYLDPGDRQRLRNALKQVEAGELQGRDQEYTFLREGGGYVPMKVSIAPVDSEEGRARFSIVATDVGELKEMHHELELRAKELEHANEELRKLDRAKDVFLSNVSHELRTPLGTIDGYLEMFESGELGKVPAPQRAAVEVMGRNVERLTAMINEMIESSRMEIRGIRLIVGIFDLARLITESVESAQPQAIKKDISLNVHVPDDLPYMWGDRSKFGQVLGILLSNALKFSHEGATVTVSAENPDKNEMRVLVTDTGIGIAPEYQEQIFRKFYQVDGSMTRHYQGTGIGLSIAKSIAEAHGGRIELDSTPGVGSTFTLTFPRDAFKSAPDHAERHLLDGLEIFVVEPTVEFRAAIATALSRAGARVHEFDAGYPAARRARDAAPDLLVLSENLPDIPPAEAVRILRGEEAAAGLPVVLLASRQDDAGAEPDIAESVEILTMPFSPDEFVTLCARVATPAAGIPQEG